MSRTPLLAALLVPLLLLAELGLAAYPLGGYERTGIRRLWAYANRDELGGPILPRGATMPLDGVRLRLLGATRVLDLDDSTAKDPTLQAALEAIFADRDRSELFRRAVGHYESRRTSLRGHR